MITVLEACEPSARHQEVAESTFVRHFDLVVGAPGGMARLRELILSLAVQGKLVSQDPNDEPVRLDTAAEKLLRLIDEGKVPKSRASELLEDRTDESDLPTGWAAARGSDVFIPRSGNSKLIKGKLYSEPAEGRYAGYSASGQDVWLSSFEYDGTAVILSAVGARCGKAFLARGKWSAIANTHIVWPLEGIVTGEYAMLLLNDENFWIRSGGAQPFLKVTETLQITVLIPPLKEQTRIVARVDELMHLCDALEVKGRLEAEQHARLLGTLLGTLTDSSTPEELAANWQRVADHFDLLLDRPEAVDALEQTILQLAVRGLLVPQDPNDEPASELLERIRAEKDRLVARGTIKPLKPLAEASDDDQPYELPSGWEWSRIGSIGVTSTGGTPPTSRPECFGNEIAFIGPGQISARGEILTAEKYISELGRLETSIAESGDLLMVCIGGSIGKCAMVQRPTAFNQQINCIHLLFGSSTYLLATMRSLDFQRQVLDAATGSATPIISKGKWDTLLVPVPPLSEQARIVTRVEELRGLCADLRQRLDRKRTTQALLADALLDQALAAYPCIALLG